MWPWEHAAVGYVAGSILGRVVDRDPPGDREVLLLLLGTQFPDVVDKPLSWGLGWVTTGYALGHSLVLAGALSALALAVSVRRDHRSLGVAFVLGYLTHLLGDVLAPVRRGAPVAWDRLLWPFAAREPYATERGLGRGVHYLSGYVTDLAVGDVGTVAAMSLGLSVATLALWVVDGRPGTRTLGTSVRVTLATVLRALHHAVDHVLGRSR